MTRELRPTEGLLGQMSMLRIETDGPVVHLRLNRPDKRNALNETLVRELQTAFVNLPKEARVAVLSGEGAHFSAGLDLSEVTEQSVAEGIVHSRKWHAAFDLIQFGQVPVIAVLHGAVVGGGLELAATAHLRVAEASSFYGLPEGQRGIFVGGSGSARIPRLMGVSRMTDMMLTGRVFDAAEGQAAGLSNYLVDEGEGLNKALELARKIATNAPLSNYAITQALPRIAEMAPAEGLFVESLMSAIAQGDEAAKKRVRDFLEKRAGKVGKSS
jgi:enoyl-CoA hydratase/carnithine racemase